MERNAQEELKAHLMETNEEFRKLAGQHSEYARKLEMLEKIEREIIGMKENFKGLYEVRIHGTHLK